MNATHARPEGAPPARLERLWLPERAPVLGRSVREAERELEASSARGGALDLTYADTKRFPPPAWAIDDFVAAARGHGMSYTPYRGDASVRGRVAPNLGRFLGVPVDPDRELILTPGTQAGLFAALAALVDAGDRVLLVDPDYLSSERILRFLGAEVVHLPLLWEHAGNPTLDFDAFTRALDRRPRLLLLSHPNNPTGAVFDDSVLRRIAELVQTADLLVVVDELYSRLVYDRRPFRHLVGLAGLRERCVTLLGPSKTESMSGFRLGVAVAPPTVIDRMEDVLGIVALRAPAYAQHALVRWLAEDQEFVAQRIVEYQRLRDYTVERFARTDRIDVAPPQGTAYLFPRFTRPGASDHDVAKRLLEAARVIVNPGYQFGPRGIGHFRICFAQDEAVWGSAVERIAGVLDAWNPGR